MFGLGLSLFQRAFRGGMSYVYDNLKLFFSFRKHQDTPITHASSGSTSFDGTNDYVNMGDVTGLNIGDNNFSIASWIYKNGNTLEVIFSKGAFGVSGGYAFACGDGSSQDLLIQVENAGGTFDFANSSTVLNDGWNHVATTIDYSSSTGLKLYINGVECAYATQNDPTSLSSPHSGTGFNARIGANNAASSNFDGKIANVGIWSRALSASEIQGIMYKKYADLGNVDKTSLVSWYGLDAESLGSELVTNGDFASSENWYIVNDESTIASGKANIICTGGFDAIRQNNILVSGKSYRIIFDIVSVSSGSIKVGYTSGGGQLGVFDTVATHTVDFVAGGTFIEFARYPTPTNLSIDNVSIKEITLDDSQGTNHGTPVGSTTNATVYGGNAPSKPRILDSAPDVVDNYGTLHSGTALSFDGTNDYVSVADDNSIDIGTSDFTFSTWIKKDTTQNQRLIDNRDATGFTLYIDNSDLVRLELNDGSGYAIYTLSSAISSGLWHHIVVSADRSGNATCYLNGYSVGSADISAKSGSLSSTSSLFIGADAPSAGSQFFDGKISSSKLFDVALTLAQIQEMYLNPEQILPTGVASSNLKLHLPMNEGAGTTNYDGSGNNNHGTISGATWVKAETEIAQTALIRSNISSNILLQSNQFDTTWTNSNISGTSGQSGYDGNSDAWLLETSTTTGSAYQSFSETGVVVFSIYAKKGSVNGTRLRIDASADYNGYFDLANGTVDASSSAGTAIESVGNGWYRCSVTGNVSSPVKVVIYTTNGTTAYASGTVYVQDSQMESGSVTGTYLETTTVSQPDDVFLSEGLTAGQDSQGTTLANTDENVLTLNGAEVVNVDNILTQIGTDTSGSIEAWVKPRDGQPSAIESMFGFGDTNAVEHLEVWNNTDGKVRALAVDAGTTKWVVETDSAIWANGESTWKHIVLVQNGTAPIIYVDGVAPAQTFSTSADKTTWFSDLAGVDNARIGCRNYNSAGNSTIFNGSIDDVRIYSDALSATEVLKNYNAGKSKHS